MHVFKFYTMLMDCLLCGLILTWILFLVCCHTKNSRDQESSHRALLERLESIYPKDAGIESWENVLHEREN